MINKHKTQLVDAKKTQHETHHNEDYVPARDFHYQESDPEDEEEESKKKESDLFKNTNLQEAMTRDKVNRDKMAEVKIEI